jgi:hypothetical protein
LQDIFSFIVLFFFFFGAADEADELNVDAFNINDADDAAAATAVSIAVSIVVVPRESCWVGDTTGVGSPSPLERNATALSRARVKPTATAFSRIALLWKGSPEHAQRNLWGNSCESQNQSRNVSHGAPRSASRSLILRFSEKEHSLL